MNKPTVVYIRPDAWLNYKSDKLNLVHIPIGGNNPVLRRGNPVGDSVGVCATEEGVQLLKDTIYKLKPEVFFHWTMYGAFTTRTLYEIRQLSPNTKIVFAQGNQVLYLKVIDKWIWDNLPYIDAVLTNTRDIDRFIKIKSQGIDKVYTFYTFGFTPEIHTAASGEADYDCFFGGGDTVGGKNSKGKFPWSRFRHDLMCRVNDKYKLRLHGGGTWPFDVKRPLHALEYFKAMHTAKIILGTYHFDLTRYYTKRTTYGGASGRLMMTRYIPEMEKDGFINHKNIVWFGSSVAEAMNLIEYYLTHDREREKIAARQRKFFVEHFSWETRLREFEDIILDFLG